MADTTLPAPRRFPKPDGAVIAILVLLGLVALFEPSQLWPTIRESAGKIGSTAPYIGFAVLALAYLKASQAENLVSRAFEGREMRAIFLAALMGGLSPFCSCEVIPFIAALLALGTPLSAVMAFWLASPLMDPAMFLVTAGTLGWDFAVAKTVFAVGLGLLGGFGTMVLKSSPVFTDPLRSKPKVGGCCGVKAPFSGRPVWAFWGEAERRAVFGRTFVENALFLLKWLTLAYLIEVLMLRHVPAEAIAGLLGQGGIGTILLGALIGAPAYLNGYAAVPLVDALITQGMAPGAGMSFMLAGGVSSIPAAIAVWALVKPRVFAAYLGYALLGAMIAGLVWQALSG